MKIQLYVNIFLGQQSFYADGEQFNGFSNFGHALSHTLAQFGCQDNFDEIVNSLNVLKNEKNILKNTFKKMLENKWNI